MLIHSKHIFAIFIAIFAMTFKRTAIHPQGATRSPIDSAKVKSFMIKLQCLWPPPSERIGRLVNRFINPNVKINPVIQAYASLLNVYVFGRW